MTDEDVASTVAISSETYQQIARRVEESSFDTVDEYVEFVLEELLAQLEGTAEELESQNDEVRDRLRELGYLE